MKYSRKDYMNDKCTHIQYYDQYVSAYVKQRVLAVIGKDRLMQVTADNLDEIGLSYWAAVLSPLSPNIGNQMRQAGDIPSMSGAVCIAKAAALQIIKENK